MVGEYGGKGHGGELGSWTIARRAPNREPGLTFPAEARLQVLPGGMEGQGQ
jgi:hypothetical protein